MSQPPDFSSGNDDAFELRKIVELILEKLWIPILTTILAIGAGIAFLKLAQPIYEATATVEVLLDSRNPAGLESLGMNMASAEALATVEANLQRTSLFGRVLERGDIAARTGLGFAADAAPIDRALQLDQWTNVRLRRGTRLIDVSVQHLNPELAMLLANGIVDEYIAERIELDRKESVSAFEMLMVERKEIESRLKALEANHQMIDKTLEIRASIIAVEEEVEAMSKTKGPLHPEVKAASNQVTGMYDDLEKWVTRARNSLANTARGADAGGSVAVETGNGGPREEALMTAVDELELVQLSLDRDIESERAVAAVIVAALKEAEINKDMQSTRLALSDPAFDPRDPVSPRPVMVLGIATVLGGGAGLLVILALFFLNNAFSTVPEAEAATGLSVLGAIPYDKRLPDSKWLDKSGTRTLAAYKQHLAASAGDDGKSAPARPRASKRGTIEPVVLLSDPGSLIAESFRTLRTTLGLRGGDAEQKITLVISAVPNEGKSFVASNLATALAAQAGQRTLLIDADLRRPSVERIFDLEHAASGLSEALREGSDDLMSLVEASGIPNLDILPAGAGSPNPAELLSSPVLPALLAEFGKVYDRIVIDVAPVNAVADGLLLAPHAQSVLLVVRAGRTPASAVNHAIQLLADAGSPPDGLVLNQIKARSRTAANPYASEGYTRFQKYGENYG